MLMLTAGEKNRRVF